MTDKPTKLTDEQRLALAADLRSWGEEDAAGLVDRTAGRPAVTPQETEEAAARGLLDHLNRTITPWHSTTGESD